MRFGIVLVESVRARKRMSAPAGKLLHRMGRLVWISTQSDSLIFQQQIFSNYVADGRNIYTTHKLF